MTLADAIRTLTSHQISNHTISLACKVPARVALRVLISKNPERFLSGDDARRIIQFAERVERGAKRRPAKPVKCRICGRPRFSSKSRSQPYCRECLPVVRATRQRSRHAAICGEIIVPSAQILYDDGMFRYARPRKCIEMCMMKTPDAYWDCLESAAEADWPGWRFRTA